MLPVSHPDPDAMHYKPIILALLAGICAPAQAQYKCLENGKTVYADQPCSRNAQSVRQLQDNLTAEQQIERLELSIKQRQERNSLEAVEADERAAAADRKAFEAKRQRKVASDQRRKCNELQAKIEDNQRSIARYQDFGWQRSLTHQETQLKQNRERYEDECERRRP